MKRKTIETIVLSGLLCAIGIIIPIFSPVKIVIEPASFTLASHVAIFIGVFVSPVVAVSVSLGTTLGFLLAGFSPLIVLRALTHIVFALTGALILQKNRSILQSLPKTALFCLLLAVIHAACEFLAIAPFYLSGSSLLSPGYYGNGFFYSVVFLIGIGTVIHSTVDFILAYIVWRPLSKSISSDIPVEIK